MKPVAKYNTCKGISTVLTLGTPITTLAICGAEIVTPAGKISFAGAMVILITLLFAKDKLAENFKVPSAFVVSIVGLMLILLVENILVPIKAVFIATMITSGIDELTFKSFYKQIEALLPEQAKVFKKFGFIFASSEKILSFAPTQNKETEGGKV